MEFKLKKKPKNPIIIEGFPGFGLVGTIASEFLIDHLETEQIGKIEFEDVSPLVAIHESKVVEPLGIFYDKKYNMVILHAVTASSGFEWELADTIVKLAKDVGAKQVISLEGVGSASGGESESRVFYYASKKINADKFSKIGMAPLKEGIIMGVTGALLLKKDELPISCIFAETHTNMPDSKAAAKIIRVLDDYLGLEIDPKPLLQQAEKFEKKLKDIFQQSKQSQDLSEKKKMSYVG